MTTMPINNHPLTQRRLQFIGISINKLTLKSINIIQSSNNYNIVSSSICWNQVLIITNACMVYKHAIVAAFRIYAQEAVH